MEAADYFTASNQIAVDALDTVTRNLGSVSAEDQTGCLDARHNGLFPEIACMLSSIGG